MNLTAMKGSSRFCHDLSLGTFFKQNIWIDGQITWIDGLMDSASVPLLASSSKASLSSAASC